MVACNPDCSAGSATLTTVPSMKAMLDPRIVAANTHAPALAEGSPGEPARIAASSQGGLAMLGMTYFEQKAPPRALRPRPAGFVRRHRRYIQLSHASPAR